MYIFAITSVKVTQRILTNSLIKIKCEYLTNAFNKT